MFKGFTSWVKESLPQMIGDGRVTALGGHAPPKRGTRELLELYSKSPWLHTVVNKVGVAVSEVEWRLFAKPNSSGAGFTRDVILQRTTGDRRAELIQRAIDMNEVTQIKEHPLLDLILGGNRKMLGDNVFQVTQHHIDLIGEGYWLLERNRLGVPVSVWPLPPDWIKRFPTNGHPFYTISARSGTQHDVPETEVIIFRDPDPADPYGRGSGMAKSLGDELEIDEYASKHTKAFFYNRARPDIIISGDNMSPEDAKRLEFQWLEKHQGFWKAFKPLFFSRKIDIKDLTHTMDNVQMVPLRKHTRDAIIQVYGAPPEKFGIVSDSKRSTIAAADLFWTKDIIRPRLERLRATMQARLVPMFDDRLILDYVSPVILDEEMEIEVMKANAAAFTINDWRAKANHKSLGPNGDVLVVPLNSSVLDPDESLVDQHNESPENVDSNTSSDSDGAIEEALEQAITRQLVAPLTEAVPEINRKVLERALKR